MKSFFLFLATCIFLIAIESQAQELRVIAGVRTSIIDWNMKPNFFPVPNSFGMKWDFKAAIGYEFGLSRTYKIGLMQIEPSIRYCKNTLTQEIQLYDQKLELVDVFSLKTCNNVFEIAAPIKLGVNVNRNKLYFLLGGFGQFRRNETVHSILGKNSERVIRGGQFDAGICTGIETQLVRNTYLRIQGQFSRTVYATWNTPLHGYTISSSIRYNIKSMLKKKKQTHDDGK